MARRDFKLRFLLNPAYVALRWKELSSPQDVLARAAGVLRYAFFRFLWDPYYAGRAYCGAGARALEGFWLRRHDAFRAREERRFCSRPFRMLQIHRDGAAFTCCPGWMPVGSIGDLSRQSFGRVWNGEKAQEIRRSILDGSFRYCDADQCIHLRNADGPVRMLRDVQDEELKSIIAAGRTVMPRGPTMILCAFDRSCNLSCPTCRTETIVEAGNRRQILDIQEKIEREAFRDAKLLYISGSGDPFGSPMSRDWLRSFSAKSLGAIRIHLHTNGQLWTREAWEVLPADVRKAVVSAEISVDAASPEVYAVNRRGGRFEKLLENFDFIGDLRRRGPLEYLEISMVVQENNFREMPEFVRLGRRLGVDRASFLKLHNGFETFSPEELSRRCVHLPSHPDFSELLRVLRDPVFRDPIAFLGNLSYLRSCC